MKANQTTAWTYRKALENPGIISNAKLRGPLERRYHCCLLDHWIFNYVDCCMKEEKSRVITISW